MLEEHAFNRSSQPDFIQTLPLMWKHHSVIYLVAFTLVQLKAERGARSVVHYRGVLVLGPLRGSLAAFLCAFYYAPEGRSMSPILE